MTNQTVSLRKYWKLFSATLKAGKSKFSWLGSFEQLLQFAEEQLGLNLESMKVSENETKKTIKTERKLSSTGFTRQEHYKFKFHKRLTVKVS